jgi:hypothetical protein
MENGTTPKPPCQPLLRRFFAAPFRSDDGQFGSAGQLWISTEKRACGKLQTRSQSADKKSTGYVRIRALPETGLLMCPPEKTRTVTAFAAEQCVLSSPLCRASIAKNWACFAYFGVRFGGISLQSRRLRVLGFPCLIGFDAYRCEFNRIVGTAVSLVSRAAPSLFC